jgi:hypothetical protein
VPAKSVARRSLGNESQLIPPSESDEEPGKICALLSSQMGRREISEFPIEGVSRPKTPSEVVPSLWMNAPLLLKNYGRLE